MSKKIYVASSWRNPYFDTVIKLLNGAGHLPFNFKQPRPGVNGFSWSAINPDWVNWSLTVYRSALGHEIATAGFIRDFMGMTKSDECLLVCPSGRSAHLEAGYCAGQGKEVVAFMIEKQEPELMYNFFNTVLVGWEEFYSYYGIKTI